MTESWTPDPSDLDLLDESRREWRRDEHWADIADLLVDIDVPMPPPLEPDAPEWERELLRDDNSTDDEPVDEPEDPREFLRFVGTLALFAVAGVAIIACIASGIGYLIGRAS